VRHWESVVIRIPDDVEEVDEEEGKSVHEILEEDRKEHGEPEGKK
jgi:hypothetical protein